MTRSSSSVEADPAPPFVLIVDDDADLLAVIALHVGRWGMRSASVSSAAELWRLLDREIPDAVLLDVLLGDADGSQLVAEIKTRHGELPVIMITRSTSVEAAVRCMKHGASDYITKPLDFERLRDAVTRAVELGRVSHRLARQDELGTARDQLHGLIGRSPAMQRLFGRIESLAPSDVSALVLGETGTGKELVARAIHAVSPRHAGPFVAVNAAAIPHELIESQLFGHEKGAFTGAHRTHVGYCEQADGGTLFLDEIAEMDVEVQAKLLRFLQDHAVQRVGGRTVIRVDVRVLAATNAEPHVAIADRRLREDLYYRLRVVTLQLPPLRERAGDVALLAQHFLERAARRHRRTVQGIAADALERLEAYPWPGNVRELENVIEEAVVLHRGTKLTADRLPAEIVEGRPPAAPATDVWPGDPRPPRWNARESRQRDALVAALERTGWVPEDAARELGVSRATIYRRIKKFELMDR